VLLVAVTACSQSQPRLIGARPGALQAVKGFPRGAANRLELTPPPVPRTGAYLGAWVQPHVYTPAGRQLAVHTLEAQLGRRLDIVHTYRTITQPFPGAADVSAAKGGSFLLLSLALDDARRVASGAEDNFWRTRALAIRNFAAPVFVEPQWEFDRPNLHDRMHSAADYVAAWRHLRTLFDEIGTPNVAWVWCPTADGFATGRAQAYFPGADQVDWLCVDAYPVHRPTPLGVLIKPFVQWAAGLELPTMVGEFGIPRSVAPAARATWLLAAARAMQRAGIRAAVYYDSSADALGFSSAAQDYRLATDARTLGAFRRVAHSPYFDPQRLVASP